jgi:hypothetical protein
MADGRCNSAFAAANIDHRPLGWQEGCSMGMDDEWVMQQHYMYIVLLHHPSAIPLHSPFTFQ